MVPHQSSDSLGDRPPSHQESRHEARIPATVSSSEHHPLAYDPYASAHTTTPPNVASQRGSGQFSSNIASIQSVDNTLLADYMRQAQEVSRMFHLLQQDMQTRSQNPLPSPNVGPSSSTWVNTPTIAPQTRRPDSISHPSDLRTIATQR
jgi:hypothetical protein